MDNDGLDKELADLLSEVEKTSSKGEPVPEVKATDLLDELAEPKATKSPEATPSVIEQVIPVTEPTPVIDPVDELTKATKTEIETNPDTEKKSPSLNDINSLSSILEQKEDPKLAKIRSGLVNLLESVMDNSASQLAEFTEDRKHVDKPLDILISRLQNGTEMSAAQLNALAMLVQTRADISANRSKYIDSVAKLFASLKKNETIIVPANSNSSLSQNEITAVLKQTQSSE